MSTRARSRAVLFHRAITIVTRTSHFVNSSSNRYFHAATACSSLQKKTALVVGSSGSLGFTVAKYLSRQENMTVIGADVLELPNESDWQLDDFVPLPHYGQYPTLADITERLSNGVDFALGTCSLDALVVASGGWQMDPVSSLSSSNETPFDHAQGARAYGESMETMMRMNFFPVAAAGYIAQHYMSPEGLFVVMGATAALSPTPGMIGYGVSKSAAHQFVQTLGATTGLAVATKSQRKEGRKARRDKPSLDSLSVVGILPTVLDTPTNRTAMPDANFDEWTKPIDIAKEIGMWVSTPPLRPHSGSLVKVFTNSEGAHFQLVR